MGGPGRGVVQGQGVVAVALAFLVVIPQGPACQRAHRSLDGWSAPNHRKLPNERVPRQVELEGSDSPAFHLAALP